MGTGRPILAAVALAAGVVGLPAGCSGHDDDASTTPAKVAEVREPPRPARTLGAPAAGVVRFVKSTDSSFDRYTRTSRYARWINHHFWRMKTFAPYFNQRLRWYSRAWAYRDLYAVYRSSALVRRHPDWILRDSDGRPLYIPFACAGGTCPQYAADIANPAFRAWWIHGAQATVRRGYRGLFIDDVNMLMRVGDGSGREVPPVDSRTGREMSPLDWRRLVARFTEEIRRALPSAELVHNAIWFAGDRDPFVRRELAAADLVYLEHGVDDPGIRTRGGRFGYETLLAYADHLHRQGVGVVLSGESRTDAEREYGLASYFLVNGGSDALGNRAGALPGSWWRGYDVALGAPHGRRYRWRGLLRRDFERGAVLVNPPGGEARRVKLSRSYVRIGGHARGSVALEPAAGAVLRRRGR